MEYFHCTRCGKKYRGVFYVGIPKSTAKTGVNKGKVVPMCCRKELRKISGDVYSMIEEHGE